MPKSQIITSSIANAAVDTTQLAADAVDNTILDVAGNYTFTGTITGAGDLSVGVSQTYTDVTSSRAIETVYTNSTGRPIFVSVLGTTGTSASMKWKIGGTESTQNLYTNSTNGRNEISAIVPNNVTYEVSGNASIEAWMELR